MNELFLDGWMNGLWMDDEQVWMGGWVMDGWMDRWIDAHISGVSYVTLPPPPPPPPRPLFSLTPLHNGIPHI